MKHILKLTLLLAALMCCGRGMAYDFCATNADGKMLYYNIMSSTNLTVAVTYQFSGNGNYSSHISGTVTIPSAVTYNSKTYSVTSIGYYAFMNSDLTSVTIPSSVTSIGGYAFSDCSGLTSVTIPSSVTSIGGYAFSDCSGLTSVSIPSSVTSIGDAAFSNCSGLTSVTIPSGVTSIRRAAFSGCSSLTSVSIPSSVTSIGDYAFYGCSNLTSVTIPSGMTSIGDYAFYDCVGLTSVICQPVVPPTIHANTFSSSVNVPMSLQGYHRYKGEWQEICPYCNIQLQDDPDVVFFYDKPTASSYKTAMKKMNKNLVTSVAFMEGVGDDLTEALIKQGMNPNCLYYLPKDAALHGSNIVDNYWNTAESLELTDDYPYYCAAGFSVKEVTCTHTPSVWADGKNGWETICLPFAPEEYTASGSGRIWPITLGAQGNFWLRKFINSSDEAVFFTSTLDGRMEANTPYIVAFPGASMGRGHLQGQTITFSAKNVTIPVTVAPHIKKGSFTFVGNYDVDEDEDVSEGWKLDDAGSAFSFAYEVGDEPFRAYFVPEAGAVADVRALRIEYVKEDADGVLVPEAEFGGRLSETCGTTARGTFDLQGRRVAEAGAVKSGLYIKDGHKVVVR